MFTLPGADRIYGDVDDVSRRDLAPAYIDKGTNTYFNDHRVTVIHWQETGINKPYRVVVKGEVDTPNTKRLKVVKVQVLCIFQAQCASLQHNQVKVYFLKWDNM